MAAVRKVGGRFLELDERSGIYVDIGDKKATEKTSQALREGQTKIRKKLYEDENEGSDVHREDVQHTTTNNNAPSCQTLNKFKREISSDAYLGYSAQVLESLYIADENASDASMSSDNGLVVAAAAAAAATANDIGTGIAKHPALSPSSAALLNSIAMMKAIGQVQEQQQGPTYHREQQQQRSNREKHHHQQTTTTTTTTPLTPPLPVSAFANNVNNVSGLARALEQFPGAAAPPAHQQRAALTHMDQRHRQNQERQQQQQTPLTPPLPAPSSAYVNAASGLARALVQFPWAAAPPAQQQRVVAPTTHQDRHHQNQRGQQQRQQHMTFPLPMPPALTSSAYVNNVSGLARALEQFSGVTPMAQHVAPAKQQQQQQQQNQQQSMYPPQPRYAKRDLDPVAMARILEQFPGTAQAYSQVDPSLHHAPNGRFVNMSPMRISEAGIGGGGGGGGGGFGEERLTNMSLASMFSIQSLRRLLESARNDHYRQAADRGTIESTLSAEIRDLIQLSAPQLEQVDNLPMEDTEPHVGREVDSFYGEMEDRVSELRFTDVSRWSAVGEAEYKPRLTDSSEHTNFSKTSSMDASMRSSTTEESVRSSPDCKRSKYNTHRHSGGDIASAELLLRLSASDASPSRMGGREGSLGKDA